MHKTQAIIETEQAGSGRKLPDDKRGTFPSVNPEPEKQAETGSPVVPVASSHGIDLFRLFKKARLTGSGCLEIGSPKLRGRYHSFRLGGVVMDAHRAMWIVLRGPIPDGKEVCHACDNDRCINPGHLWLGTHKENMADMIAKGRASFWGIAPPKQLQVAAQL